MKKMICINHHYYDGEKYESCPICGAKSVEPAHLELPKPPKPSEPPEPPKLFTYYTNRCGNCHKPLGEDDKYCRYCGTRRGEGAFEPYDNVMKCIYGPPPMEEHSIFE